MGQKPKVRGYKWNEHVAEAIEANTRARRHLALFLGSPSGGLGNANLARLSQAMGDTLAALHELKSIGEGGSNAPVENRRSENKDSGPEDLH